MLPSFYIHIQEDLIIFIDRRIRHFNSIDPTSMALIFSLGSRKTRSNMSFKKWTRDYTAMLLSILSTISRYPLPLQDTFVKVQQLTQTQMKASFRMPFQRTPSSFFSKLSFQLKQQGL